MSPVLASLYHANATLERAATMRERKFFCNNDVPIWDRCDSLGRCSFFLGNVVWLLLAFSRVFHPSGRALAVASAVVFDANIERTTDNRPKNVQQPSLVPPASKKSVLLLHPSLSAIALRSASQTHSSKARTGESDHARVENRRARPMLVYVSLSTSLAIVGRLSACLLYLLSNESTPPLVSTGCCCCLKSTRGSFRREMLFVEADLSCLSAACM